MGVITLTGTTATEANKAHAESIAKSVAVPQVSDQIAVRPSGNESVAKRVDSDHDKAIKQIRCRALEPREPVGPWPRRFYRRRGVPLARRSTRTLSGSISLER
jgi:hypothetical protein